jgi:YVTN family beta-propeller protein
MIYVARGHRGDVAAFDTRTGELAWTVPLQGFRADHMAISPDGAFLYVSDIFENELNVIDTGSAAIVARVPTGMWPHDNQVTPDGERVLNASIGLITKDVELLRQMVSDQFDDVDFVSPVPVRFDALPNLEVASVEPVEDPDAEDATALGPYDYVHLITVVDARTHEILDVHRFDLGGQDVPEDFARGVRPNQLLSDGRMLYAQLSDFKGVIEYDLQERALTRHVELVGAGGGPAMVGLEDDRYLDIFRAPHHGLAPSGDESLICLAGRADDQAFLVDRAAMSEVAALDVGLAPGWATTGPDGNHCFVTNEESNDVSVISFGQRIEMARIPVGDGPKHAVAAVLAE